MFVKIFDWLRLSPEEYCEKYGHDVKEWHETSGSGKFGDCERCGEKKIHFPYSD